MHPFIGRFVVAFLLAVIILQYLLFSESSLTFGRSSQRFTRVRPAPRPVPASKSDSPDAQPQEWLFNHERDGRNIALTPEQCDAAFPDLYYAIDETVAYWKKRNFTITDKEIEVSWRRDGAVRCLIHDNQLRIIQKRPGYTDRTTAVLSQLHRALLGATVAGERLPDIDFSVVVDDMSLIPGETNHTAWSFTRLLPMDVHGREWLMPDFNFWSSPGMTGSWIELEDRAKTHDTLSVADKLPQVIWRGARWTNEPIRGSLLDVTHNQPWADVQEVFWKNGSGIMRMEDMCDYEFVAHTEGRSWSGRLKYLLACDSIPIVHKLDWATHYYHLLNPDGPDQNYIPVKRDFSDLKKKVKYYLDHPDEAERIRENAKAHFRERYITSAAQACYWRRLIHGYNSVTEPVNAFEKKTFNVSGKIIEEEVPRGMAFEEFINWTKDVYPDPDEEKKG